MKNHLTYIDVLRIIACFLVIVNHTVKDSFLGFEYDFSASLATLYLTVIKIAVPIFLMISGILLFQKEETFKTVWRKRILPLVCVIIVFSFFVYGVIEQRNFSLIHWFEALIHKPAFVSYWYLYTLLGIYIILPILQKIVQVLNEKDMKVILWIWFIFNACLPFIAGLRIFPNLSNDFVIPLITNEIGYMFLGYFLIKFNKEKYSMKFYIYCFISLIFVCYFYNVIEYKVYDTFLLLLDRACVWSSVLLSICTFKIVILFFENYKLSNRWKEILQYIGETTFGIYLVHGITLWCTVEIQQYLLAIGNRFVGVVIYGILIFFLSFIIVRILAWIPFLRKLLHIRFRKNKSEL